MTVRATSFLVAALAVATLVSPAREQSAHAGPTNTSPSVRPAEWAQPVNIPGAPNLHKVSNNLYRGAQPTSEGMRGLAELGVKTVVNLRSFHSDSDLIKGTGLRYEHITMKAWHAEEHEVVRFLAIVTDTNKTPVFVHCHYGSDRTGTMCAVYRIVINGWTKEQAAREMRDGGFDFHDVWQNLIGYIEGLDIESIRTKAGIKR